MKRSSRNILIVILLMILSSTSFYLIENKLIKKEKNYDELINISELSEDFVNNYLNEVKKLNENNEENLLIVVSKNGIKNNYGATKVIETPNYQYILEYNSKENKNKALSLLKDDKSIFSVEENIIYTSDKVTNANDFNSWGIEKMNINSMLDKISVKNLNDITVAIIDTGCDMNLFNSSFNGKIEETVNLHDEHEMYDNFGHGTHIAGTIAEATPNNVKILPIKVSDSSRMSNINIIAAINYIVYYENADVINMSFGTNFPSEAEHIAIEAAKKKNIISVAAAGNDNTNEEHYPSNFENTISISAVDANSAKATFSNYGNSINFSAPGVDIVSINGTMSGTSMATPHAVSAVAILKSLNKNISFDDTITLLRRYSEDLGDPGWDQYYGYGFIDFEDAQICDGIECDEYNIFKNDSQDELQETIASYEFIPIISEYNYGSINNILSTEVDVRYTNGNIVKYELYDFADLKITGYDPYKVGTEWQTINVSFTIPLGIEINGSFNIRHTYKKDSVWTYNIINDNSIELTSFKDINFSGNQLYIPSTIDQYNVVAIADSENSIFETSREAFMNVNALYLPSTLIKLGNNAFNGINNNLEYVKSEAENIEIGNNAFYQSQHLSKIEANLSYVGDYAFFQVGSIDGIKLSDNLKYIGASSFAYTGSNNEFVIPQNVETIGTDAFDNSKFVKIKFLNQMEKIPSNMFTDNDRLKKIILPEGLKEIESYAFSGCYNIEEIYMSKSITTISNNAFSGINLSYATFYVYNDSYPKEYFSNNDLYHYVQIDPDSIEVINFQSSYFAFNEVNLDNISIELTYNEKNTRTEIINKNIKIEYQSALEGFRYGDTKFKIIAHNQIGYLIEKNIEVTINKATPSYTVPLDLTAEVGQTLSEIELPYGFSWMDRTENISEVGNKVFKAKFTPDDITNYEVIENIDINIMVGTLTISNNTTDFEGIYDGNNHTININVDVDNYTISYSINNTNYDLSMIPQFNEVGEHIINYKITAEGYDDLIGSNKVKIYGIKSWGLGPIVKSDFLVITNNSFNSFKNGIDIYSSSKLFNHLDNDKNVITTDQIKTGEYFKVTLNNSKIFEYQLAYLGDVNGNGNVDIIDYIRIMKDIMGAPKLSGVYYEAADMNRNNKIDIIDYIRIMKIIMEDN